MTDRLNFKIPPSTKAQRKPLVFAIEGEEFQCKAWLPGSLLLEHERLLVGRRYGGGATAILGFFEDAMRGVFREEPPAEGQPDQRIDEYTRFRRFVDDERREIEVPLLTEIMMVMVTEYAKRPTGPSSVSAPGSAETGTGSTDG